jgi:hypothetical protein
VIQEPEDHIEIGISLSPPGDVSPTVDAYKAAEIAWSEERPMGTPKSSEAFLGLISGGFGVKDNSLVWVVRYAGMCVPMFGGPSGPHDICAPMNTTWTVIVDATTGEFVQAYSDE